MAIHTLRALAFVAGAASLAACGGSFGPGTPSQMNDAAQSVRRYQPNALPDMTKTLYVASRGGNAILGFPANANGDVAPTVTISGSNTQLGAAIGLAISHSGKIYVMDDSGSEVLIFPPGSNGNVTPTMIAGSKVPITESEGVALDAQENIYVSSFRNNAVWVFHHGVHGNVAPIRTIQGELTGLNGADGMAFDSAGDLYVANYYGSSSGGPVIAEFAPNANGNVAPIATLGGSLSGLSSAFNVSIDANDRIIVANSEGTSISIFAPGSNGNVAPVAKISGRKTQLTDVTSTGVDATGKIFATNIGTSQDSILVFAAGANGNVKPMHVISGPSTEINDVFNPVIH